MNMNANLFLIRDWMLKNWFRLFIVLVIIYVVSNGLTINIKVIPRDTGSILDKYR